MNEIQLESMLKQFFIEDIGDGDLSGEALFSRGDRGSFTLVAKEAGIFCGGQILQRGFTLIDPSAVVNIAVNDGEMIVPGTVLAEVAGTMQGLLKAERVVLNLIQRMSGIATATAAAVKQTAGTRAKICDTRKTTPGLRMLEKYAVKAGGGYNHRRGLYDAVMLKDNHIAFAGGIKQAIEKARATVGHTVKIEVEIETKQQLAEAVEAGADIIMFDNRTPQEIQEWLPLVPEGVATEASGGIPLDGIRPFAESGVDWISLGALTHSIRALDISAKVITDSVKEEADHVYLGNA
ncbi:carboxylating nicotinate-nucleotide diphosphorylase [Bacillus badius]|uniref:nicotinate-nucleotide diphosphorylase (carboxylating) n=1 Tax=Bacillus badius TaxID=1455 RepID=A0ABR5ATK6_BACBA|nr:carboxylating nicotinate-nucleotide diphosphorylase [Bacillus badius]KIL75458.1 Quinolinate phosphoribosyltransferase [Bacillus badius]KIL77979.1 Quinolinate phosphoribosyltransferase [Bacillus badius]MED4716410.1 carboxylating nicotinate-nucleotide diphosphorylase [Bacillus badius]